MPDFFLNKAEFKLNIQIVLMGKVLFMILAIGG